MRNKKKIIYIIILIVSFLLAFIYFLKKDKLNENEIKVEKLKNLRYEKLERKKLNGTIVNLDLKRVSSVIDGEISEINVKKGEKVKKGDLIATYSKEDIVEAEMEKEKIKNQLKSVKLEKEKYLLQKEQTLNSLEEEANQIETNLQESIRNLKKSKLVFENLEGINRENEVLVKAGSISKQTFFETKMEFEKIKLEINQNESEITNLKDRKKRKLKNISLKKLEFEKVSSLSNQKKKELELELLEKNNQVELLKNGIKSSKDGIVVNIYAYEGEFLKKDQKILTILDPNKNKVILKMSPINSSILKKTKKIYTIYNNERISLNIDFISSVLEKEEVGFSGQKEYLPVYLNSKKISELPLGTKIEVIIEEQEKPREIVIGKRYLKEENNNYYLETLDNNQVKKVYINEKYITEETALIKNISLETDIKISE